MFHHPRLFPIITLPLSPALTANQPPHFASATLFRKTLHEKPSFSKENTQESPLGSRKSIERADLIFENDFKRKYHSVCSQMIKIKQAWSQSQSYGQGQESRPTSPPAGKFYQRVGSNLVKGSNHAHRSKLKSKYNTRQSLKARQTLKLEAWSGKTHNADCKLHTLYEREARLEKELTAAPAKKLSISNKCKAVSKCRAEQSSESIDLRGWNHLQEIREDDLYEPV